MNTHPPQLQNPSKLSPAGANMNVVAKDVEIRGTIKFSRDFIVDGRIEGEVQSGGCLTIGENAVIQGEIKTSAVVVFGKVQGNMTVDGLCFLKNDSVVIGDITAGTLSIEEGATFVGQSAVGKRPQQTKP